MLTFQKPTRAVPFTFATLVVAALATSATAMPDVCPTLTPLDDDMRPLGEFDIADPTVEPLIDRPAAPHPATVALAGMGLATLLTGRFKRREHK